MHQTVLKIKKKILDFAGDQGLHIGNWNNLQARCSDTAEKGRAAKKKGQWGLGTEKSSE